MRVLVAGATGVIGRQLAPLLAEVGHEVVALARSDRRRPALGTAGVEFAPADALDRAAVAAAVAEARPDAVVHLLTTVPAEVNPRRLARDLALTNRLRTEGTRNLLDAAAEVGVRRVITQGLAYAYEPTGGPVKDEDAPLWTGGPAQFRPVVAALAELERRTGAAAGGLVLRFGQLYGPGSAFAADGAFVRQLRAGKLPVVGDGGAVWSFTHAHDAATAIAAALDKPVTGVLNVVDDSPVPVREWLPELAGMLGAPAPKRVPALLARLAVGQWGVAYMTRLRGADNTRARLRLDWRPRYGTWREGFAAELSPTGR
ncbi:MAG: NAD-dependent epimerase/dehydratase family protein [Mycobacteriales bacterium]